jgi:hypothetical protein
MLNSILPSTVAGPEIVLSASQTVGNAVSDLRGDVEDFLKNVAV